MTKRKRLPHEEAVEEILWGLALGMTRAEIGTRLGYRGKNTIDMIIARERKRAWAEHRESRL